MGGNNKENSQVTLHARQDNEMRFGFAEFDLIDIVIHDAAGMMSANRQLQEFFNFIRQTDPIHIPDHHGR